MITKLGVYGFSQDALQCMRSYLTNRQQRVRVNSDFSTWENIIAGVLNICDYNVTITNHRLPLLLVKYAGPNTDTHK